jgi:hypothetical protein
MGKNRSPRGFLGQFLNGSASVISQAHAGRNDRFGSKILGCPVHSRKLGCRNRETTGLPRQLCFNFVAAPNLNPVVFGNVARYLG